MADLSIVPQEEDLEWVAFRSNLERAVGVPLWQYKEAQMKRRLANVMSRSGIRTWAEFSKALATDRKLLTTVQDTLTINVSEFYRQADRFLDLEKTILPRLMETSNSLRIWSAGCSIGCEPYTLSMILDQLDPKGRHTIIATDVDVPILARAKAGTGYFASEVRAVPPKVLAKYFEREPAGTYKVAESLKSRIQFKRHDLLKDAYPNSLDLILCRNVVIYFTEEAKRTIYEGFSSSLREGGTLFVGGSEMLIRSHELGLRATGAGMYVKAA